MNPLLYLAASESHETAKSSSGGLLSALGIDATLLLLQGGAFLVLVLILGKFVYPHLIKAIDDRREAIESAAGSAKKSEQELAKVEEKVAEIIRKARDEANEIVASSHKEAATVLEAAEATAGKRAEQIVAEARTQMENELKAAQDELKKETAKLVVQATEHISREKMDADKDARLISSALQEAS